MLRSIFLGLFLTCLPFISEAQFCSGTLGDNIFQEGDFGKGTANLLSPSPNIAPGYSYTFNVPPSDGSYVISNNTAVWPGIYSTWLQIGDNSPDPNGYMMVVNASHTPGLFYEQTISGLCENTLFEFSADIINLIRSGSANHGDPNVSFLLDGVEFFSTGNIPKTNNWNTYGFTFTTQPGQETLTLSLRNNAPGGFGNDLALDNLSFKACGPQTSVGPGVADINLCEGGTSPELDAILVGNQYVDPAFQWQQSFDEGLIWEDIPGANQNTYSPAQLAAGSYYYRFLVADGAANLGSDKCRVNSDEKVINVIPKIVMQSDTICEGLSFKVGNSSYSTPGTYTDSLVNFLGCDSIVITSLSVEFDPDFSAELLITKPCTNTADGIISIQNIDGGYAPYNVIFEGIDFGMTTLFPDLSGGETYTLIVQDDIGCIIELPTLVENLPELSLDLGEDQIVELGETVNLLPFYNFIPAEFNWEISLEMDCQNFEACNQFGFVPTSSQQVSLDLFDENGCSISDSIYIEVVEVRKVFIPNVFSPNGDGQNDNFTVFGDASNVHMVEEFRIFDRWGSLLFEEKNFLPNVLSNGWDGNFKGKTIPTGLYVYSARIRFVDGEVLQYKGDVYLAR